jgi:tripartite-type tricarboxylate transporter receptor subunit TctC
MISSIPALARGAILAAIAAVAASSLASADEVADFFKGKQITFQIGFGAGGGYDTNSRIVARHFGRHVPGNPSIIVQNVPGAGSMTVANRVYNTAPKDGTVLGMFSSVAAMVPLYGKREAKFQTDKFEWIGSLHRDIQGCGVWKGAGQGIRTIPDMIKAKKTVIFGSNGPSNPLTVFPLFMKNVLGANLKVVHGYKGTKEINLAMQKGELNATCGMYESSVRNAFLQDFEAGNLVIFAQFGVSQKVPLFGQATNIFDLLKAEEQKQMAKLVFGPAEITRPLAAPPGTPKARVAALRKALLDTMKDPGLIADAKKIKIEFKPIPGEEVAAMFKEYFATPRPVVDKAYEMISRM